MTGHKKRAARRLLLIFVSEAIQVRKIRHIYCCSLTCCSAACCFLCCAASKLAEVIEKAEHVGSQSVVDVLLEERIKRRKDNIAQVLYTKRKIHQIQLQPFQDIIKKYPVPEVLKDIQKGLIQDIQMEEENQQEVIERKPYARVDQYHKKSKKRSKKRCWLCKSHNHLKANCPEIKCFYCGKRGHIKANCYKKKIDYIFARLKETYKKKDINEERKRRHKK